MGGQVGVGIRRTSSFTIFGGTAGLMLTMPGFLAALVSRVLVGVVIGDLVREGRPDPPEASSVLFGDDLGDPAGRAAVLGATSWDTTAARSGGKPAASSFPAGRRPVRPPVNVNDIRDWSRPTS